MLLENLRGWITQNQLFLLLILKFSPCRGSPISKQVRARAGELALIYLCAHSAHPKSQIPNSQSQTASPSRDLPNLPFIYLFIPQALLPSLGNKSMVKTPIKHGEIRISAKRLEKEIPAFPRCHKELGRGEGAVKIPKFIPKTLSFLISIQGWLWRHFQGNNSQRIWDKSKYFICFSSGIPLWTSPSHP